MKNPSSVDVLESLLVDDSGKTWHQNSLSLRTQLHCPNYPGDLENDVIRNLGYVGIRKTRRCVFVKYRPNAVSEVALTATMFWLNDNRPSSVCFRFVEFSCPDEIGGSYANSIDRISALHVELELQKRVLATHRDINDIKPNSPLYPLLQYWKSVGGKCPLEEMRHLAHTYAHSRYAFIRRDANVGFVFTELGDGLEMPDANAIRATLARPVSQQIDTMYYTWVERNYSNGLESFRPDVADVDARVSWPHHRPVRHRYRRLLLPCLGDSGPFLFSVSSAEFTASTDLLEAV